MPRTGPQPLLQYLAGGHLDGDPDPDRTLHLLLRMAGVYHLAQRPEAGHGRQSPGQAVVLVFHLPQRQDERRALRPRRQADSTRDYLGRRHSQPLHSLLPDQEGRGTRNDHPRVVPGACGRLLRHLLRRVLRGRTLQDDLQGGSDARIRIPELVSTERGAYRSGKRQGPARPLRLHGMPFPGRYQGGGADTQGDLRPDGDGHDRRQRALPDRRRGLHQTIDPGTEGRCGQGLPPGDALVQGKDLRPRPGGDRRVPEGGGGPKRLRHPGSPKRVRRARSWRPKRAVPAATPPTAAKGWGQPGKGFTTPKSR